MDIEQATAGWVRHTPVRGPIPEETAPLLEYLYAADGVYARARREGLEAIVPVARCRLLGVGPVEPAVRLDYPRIPAPLVAEALAIAEAARGDAGERVESLFYFRWEPLAADWVLEVPEQDATPVTVRPRECGPGSPYATALVELHSHHVFEARFSRTDDEDETGFRLFAVIGELDTSPAIRVRVGVHKHLYEIPAREIFDLPEGIVDARERDERRSR